MSSIKLNSGVSPSTIAKYNQTNAPAPAEASDTKEEVKKLSSEKKVLVADGFDPAPTKSGEDKAKSAVTQRAITRRRAALPRGDSFETKPRASGSKVEVRKALSPPAQESVARPVDSKEPKSFGEKVQASVDARKAKIDAEIQARTDAEIQATPAAQAVAPAQVAGQLSAADVQATAPTVDYNAVGTFKVTDSNKLDVSRPPPSLEDLKLGEQSKYIIGTGGDEDTRSILTRDPISEKLQAKINEPEGGRSLQLEAQLEERQAERSEAMERAESWLPQAAAAQGQVPWNDPQAMADLKTISGYRPDDKLYDLAKAARDGDGSINDTYGVAYQADRAESLREKDPAKYEAQLREELPPGGYEYVNAGKTPEERKERYATAMLAKGTLGEVAQLQQRALDNGKPAGKASIPWSNHSVERTVEYGHKTGVLNKEIQQDAVRTADVVLGLGAGADLNGPPVQMRPEMFAVAVAQRIPEERINPAQLAGAMSYINGAQTLGEQRARAAGALQSFQVLDKAGRPPLTGYQKFEDLNAVSPKLGEALKGYGNYKANKVYDQVSQLVGVPGEHKLQIDARNTITLNNDENGNVESAKFKQKKESTLKKMGGMVLGALSVIPSPLQPFAAVINMAYSAAQAVKSGNIIGAVGAVAGAVAGGLGGIVSQGVQSAARVVGQVADVASAIKNKNPAGIIGSVAGAVSNFAGGVATSLGDTAKKAIAVGSSVNALRNGDIGGALGAAAGLANSEGLSQVGQALSVGGSFVSVGQALHNGDGFAAGQILGGVVNQANAAAAAQAQRISLPQKEGVPAAVNVVEPRPELFSQGVGDPRDPNFVGPPAPGLEANYQVAAGDTLAQVSARTGVSMDALLAANPEIGDPNLIRVGQKIHVPGYEPARDVLPTSAAKASNVPGSTGAFAEPPLTSDVDIALEVIHNHAESTTKGIKNDVALLDTALKSGLLDKNDSVFQIARDEIRGEALRSRIAEIDAQVKTRGALLVDGFDQLGYLRNELAEIDARRPELLAQTKSTKYLGAVKNVLGRAAVLGDAYGAYTTNTQTTTAGRVAQFVGKRWADVAVGNVLARANPLLALADASTHVIDLTASAMGYNVKTSAYSPGTFYSGAVESITSLGEAIFTKDAGGIDNVHARNLRGDNGWFLQQTAVAGDYWAKNGIGGGLSSFWDTVVGN